MLAPAARQVLAASLISGTMSVLPGPMARHSVLPPPGGSMTSVTRAVAPSWVGQERRPIIDDHALRQWPPLLDNVVAAWLLWEEPHRAHKKARQASSRDWGRLCGCPWRPMIANGGDGRPTLLRVVDWRSNNPGESEGVASAHHTLVQRPVARHLVAHACGGRSAAGTQRAVHATGAWAVEECAPNHGQVIVAVVAAVARPKMLHP
jgi:hypothetical protein